MFSPMNYAALQQKNEQLETEVLTLRAELKELKRLIFGSKRGRFIGSTGQGQLSLLADEVPAASTTS